MKTIAFDLDDVLCHFRVPLLQYANKKLGTNYTPEDLIDCEDLHVYLGISDKVYADLVHELYDRGGLLNLPLIDDVKEGLERISKHYTSYVVSAREAVYEEETLRWMKINIPFMPSSRLILTDRHKRYRKHEVCNHVIGAELMVEDSTKNAEELAANGVKTILLEHPGTGSYKPNDGIIKIKGWKSLTDYIINR